MKSGKRIGLWAGWLLLLGADLFMRGPAWLAHTAGGLRFLANYVMSGVVLLAFLSLLTRLRRSWLYWLLYVTGILLPLLIEGNYFWVYKKFLSPSIFSIFFESPGMVLTTSAANLNVPLMLFLLVVSLLAGFWIRRIPPVPRWTFFPSLLTITGFFIFFLLHWYSVTNFQHSSFAFYSSLTEDLFISQDTKIHPDRAPTGPVSPLPGSPSFIFVIGESQVLSHMSLYGYSRPTTPHLDSLARQGCLAAMQKAVALGNKTRLSVPYMLTGLEGPDPLGAFYRYPSLFNYLKAAGYHTLFISAQDLHWGYLDKYFDDGSIDLLLDGSSFSGNVDVHKGADDLVVLPHLLSYLQQFGSPFLLVYQMDGSHYPYNIHSPDSLKRFLPEESPNCINAFDNTLLVTDLFLKDLYDFVSQRFRNTWIFFSPDHGQNFGGINGRFNDNFRPDVWHNPLLVFPPAGDSLHLSLLRAKSASLVSQADIFTTILSLTGITPRYPVDGISLLDTLRHHTFVTCMEYMPTFHNDPSGIVVDTALQTLFIDFAKGSVDDYRTGKSYRYERLDPELRKMLDRLLQRKGPQ